MSNGWFDVKLVLASYSLTTSRWRMTTSEKNRANSLLESHRVRPSVRAPALGDLNCPLGCHYQSQLITALLQTNLHLVSRADGRGRADAGRLDNRGGEAPNISRRRRRRTDQDTKQTPDSAR